MHLAEVSNLENLQNGRLSTLLRSVPVDNENKLILFPTDTYVYKSYFAHCSVIIIVVVKAQKCLARMEAF